MMLMVNSDPEPGATPSQETPRCDGLLQRPAKGCRSASRLAGLHPSVEGKRVKFSGGNRTVMEGAFGESKEPTAGYWILEVKSMDEAVDRAKRVPFEALARIHPGEYGAEGEVEIRQVFELEDVDQSR